MADNLGTNIREHLIAKGAVLVGFADVSMLPTPERCGLPRGIAVAVKYDKDIICGIGEFPTPEYHDAYQALNKKLDALVTDCASFLKSLGFNAEARTLDFVGEFETDHASRHPHKTIARLAGLGWIGKSALLVTEQYGSMVRLSTVMTDAPLETGAPMDTPKCGDCMICTNACPAGAVQGNNWKPDCKRDHIFDAVRCRKTARELSDKYVSSEAGTICGKCIFICPYTQRYLRG